MLVGLHLDRSRAWYLAFFLHLRDGCLVEMTSCTSLGSIAPNRARSVLSIVLWPPPATCRLSIVCFVHVLLDGRNSAAPK